LKDSHVTKDICRKFPEISQTIPHITGARDAPAQADDAHRNNPMAYLVQQEMSIKCGLSQAKPAASYKYEPQYV
jgi:hypothetical protein